MPVSTEWAAIIVAAVLGTAGLGVRLWRLWIAHLARRDAVRPEVVLTDWIRGPVKIAGSLKEILTFGAIRNEGKGPANRIYINVDPVKIGYRPTAVMVNQQVDFLAAGKSHPVIGADISLRWKNVPENPGGKMFGFKIRIFTWDSMDYRHDTWYRVVVAEHAHTLPHSSQVAPGVVVTRETTRVRSIWRLNQEMRIRRILARLWWPVERIGLGWAMSGARNTRKRR